MRTGPVGTQCAPDFLFHYEGEIALVGAECSRAESVARTSQGGIGWGGLPGGAEVRLRAGLDS